MCTVVPSASPAWPRRSIAPLMAYANMWWGITPSALRGMLEHAGFDVVQQHQLSPFSIDVVAEPGGVPTDIYPPLHQSGERVLSRHEGVPDDPF